MARGRRQSQRPAGTDAAFRAHVVRQAHGYARVFESERASSENSEEADVEERWDVPVLKIRETTVEGTQLISQKAISERMAERIVADIPVLLNQEEVEVVLQQCNKKDEIIELRDLAEVKKFYTEIGVDMLLTTGLENRWSALRRMHFSTSSHAPEIHHVKETWCSLREV